MCVVPGADPLRALLWLPLRLHDAPSRWALEESVAIPPPPPLRRPPLSSGHFGGSAATLRVEAVCCRRAARRLRGEAGAFRG